MNTKLLIASILYYLSISVNAQTLIKGQVVALPQGEILSGANVVQKGMSEEGVTTDQNGKFFITVELPTTLVISFVGYRAEEINVSTDDFLNIQMEPQTQELEEVTLVGSRFISRSTINSPVPIDNIKVRDLQLTGQGTFDKSLTYLVPSFNSTYQPISDATAHFDPADLRGLGPSRTLVLINGKRKNPSSFVYINDTPGKSEVGVDMKSIPLYAIKRVEILRDGASSLYGSDAIAGVINVILKDDIEYTTLDLFSGFTLIEGDGFNYGFNANTGFRVGERGFVNATIGYSDQQESNRAGRPAADSVFIKENSADHPWVKANPDLNMRIGLPNMTTINLFYNSEFEFKNTSKIYSFGGSTYRRGLSYALYRTPYWIKDPFNLLHDPGSKYEGFQPTFETDIFDNTLIIGIKGKKADWQYDMSIDYGNNQVYYTINNTLNIGLKAQSPTNFDAGGYEFRHLVSNLDVARRFKRFLISVGTEFRIENFVTNAGQEESYKHKGSVSFPGLQPSNEVDKNRYNAGFYLDLGYDLSDDLLVGGAIRHEKYNDFGDNFTWKFQARYKFLNDKLALRSSLSTGFRAPSLHQVYLSNIQTLLSGQTISNQGTFNNFHTAIKALQVPELKEENSRNFTVGLAYKPLPRLSFTLDYYLIRVDDRILFTSSIDSGGVDPDISNSRVKRILGDYNITSLKFFVNAVSTITQGVDFVASYAYQLGAGDLRITFSANLNDIEIDGVIDPSSILKDEKVDIFDRKEQSRILSSRPRDKFILGLNYEITKWQFFLNNTRFGEVTWRHNTDVDKDQTFSAKVITDFSIGYHISKTLKMTLFVNNILNVYPDELDSKGDKYTDLSGRFKYPWEVNQFGINGTTLSVNLSVFF